MHTSSDWLPWIKWKPKYSYSVCWVSPEYGHKSCLNNIKRKCGVVCIYVLRIMQHQLFWQQCCISSTSWQVHDEIFKKTFCLTKMQHIAIHVPRRIICLYYHYSYHYFIYYYKVCWSRWPRALRRGFAAARLLGLRVRNPPGTGMSVSSVCCLLSSRCLRIGMISRAEESYRMWCVLV
jgi:hypothetical protein